MMIWILLTTDTNSSLAPGSVINHFKELHDIYTSAYNNLLEIFPIYQFILRISGCIWPWMSQCSWYLFKKGLFEYIKVIYRCESGTVLTVLICLLEILAISKIPPTTTGAHPISLAKKSFFSVTS
jgi:hypothetical protein